MAPWILRFIDPSRHASAGGGRWAALSRLSARSGEPRIPLDLHIKGGKVTDNLPLRQDIAMAMGKIIPGIMVTRV
jgi:hypothetical protein